MSREYGTVEGWVDTDVFGCDCEDARARVLNLTQFYGGEKKGLCLQLTPGGEGYIQLDAVGAAKLRALLGEWINERAAS